MLSLLGAQLTSSKLKDRNLALEALERLEPTECCSIIPSLLSVNTLKLPAKSPYFHLTEKILLAAISINEFNCIDMFVEYCLVSLHWPKVLRHLLQTPRYRSSLRFSQCSQLLAVLGSHLSQKENQVSYSHLLEITKCFQYLIVTWPRDLTANSCCQARSLLDCTIEFFQIFASPSQAHYSMLDTFNFIIIELGMADVSYSFTACKQLFSKVMNLWDSKSGVKYSIYLYLRLYFILLNWLFSTQDAITFVAEEQSNLLAIRDKLLSEMRSRFGTAPFAPTDQRFHETESYSFCQLAAALVIFMTEYQSCTTHECQTPCPHLLLHIDWINDAKLVLLSSSPLEKEKILHLQILYLSLDELSLENAKLLEIWNLLTDLVIEFPYWSTLALSKIVGKMEYSLVEAVISKLDFQLESHVILYQTALESFPSLIKYLNGSVNSTSLLNCLLDQGALSSISDSLFTLSGPLWDRLCLLVKVTGIKIHLSPCFHWRPQSCNDLEILNFHFREFKECFEFPMKPFQDCTIEFVPSPHTNFFIEKWSSLASRDFKFVIMTCMLISLFKKVGLSTLRLSQSIEGVDPVFPDSLDDIFPLLESFAYLALQCKMETVALDSISKLVKKLTEPVETAHVVKRTFSEANSSKNLPFLSASELFYSLGGTQDWQHALKLLSYLKVLKLWTNETCDEEVKWILSLVSDPRLLYDDVLISIYDGISDWLNISLSTLKMNHLNAILSQLYRHLEYSHLSQNPWMILMSIKIAKVLLRSSASVQQLMNAFLLRIQGKKFTEFKTGWRICSEFSLFTLIEGCPEPFLSLAIKCASHYDYYARKYFIMSVRPKEVMEALPDPLIETEKFQETLIAVCYIARLLQCNFRLDWFAKLLDCARGDWMTDRVIDRITEISRHMHLESFEFLSEMLSQGLLEIWTDFLSLPYQVFGFDSIIEFQLSIQDKSLPILIAKRAYEQLTSLSVLVNQPMKALIKRNLPSILGYLLPRLDEEDDRLLYIREVLSVDSGLLQQCLVNEAPQLLLNLLVSVTDEDGIAEIPSLYSKFLMKIHAKRLKQSTGMRKGTISYSSFISVCERNPSIASVFTHVGMLHLVIAQFLKEFDDQLLSVEKSRRFANGLVIIVIWGMKTCLYPILFSRLSYFIVRQSECEERVVTCCQLLLYLFLNASDKNSELIKEHALGLLSMLLQNLNENYQADERIRETVAFTFREICKILYKIDAALAYLVHALSKKKLTVGFNIQKMEIPLSLVFDAQQPRKLTATLMSALEIVLNEQGKNLPSKDISILLDQCKYLFREATNEEKEVLTKVMCRVYPFKSQQTIQHQTKNGEDVALEELIYYIVDLNSQVAWMASQTLLRILRTERGLALSNSLSCTDIFKFDTNERSLKQLKTRKSYSIISFKDSEEKWLLHFILSHLSYSQHPIYSQLGALMELKPSFAFMMCEYILFDSLQTRRESLEAFLGELFVNQSLQGRSCPLIVRYMIRFIEYTSSQSHPEAKTDFDNRHCWLFINYYYLARAALNLGLYTQALLFVEVGMTSSPLDKQGELLSSYQELLIEIYKNLVESDGFRGILLSADVTEESIDTTLQMKYEHDLEWTKVIQVNQIDMNTEKLLQIIKSMKNMGSYALVEKLCEPTEDLYYEALWRNQHYCSSLSSDGHTVNGYIYNCLSALQRSLQEFVSVADAGYLEQIKEHRDLDSLILITEVKGVSEWIQRKDQLFYHPHEYYRSEETLLALRCHLLYGLARYSEFRTDLESPLRSCLLYYSKICRKSNRIQECFQALNLYQKFSGTMDIAGRIEKLKILYAQGELAMAAKCLRSMSAIEMPERAKILRLLGSWVAELRSETPIDVIQKYFQASAKYADNDKSHYLLAKYADEQYQILSKEHELQAPLRQELLRHKCDELAALYKTNETSKTLEYNQQRIKKEIELDKTEEARIAKNTQEFLLLAINNYFLAIQKKEKWDLSVFRIVSLWFDNLSKDYVNDLLVNYIPLTPSRKFLNLIYQLSARLVSNLEEKYFHQALTKLIEKMALEHPYHVLYQLLALNHSSSSNKLAIASLFNKLKSKLPVLIQSMQLLIQGYVQLASETVKDKLKKYSIKQTNPLLKHLAALKLPCLTTDLPISTSYETIPVMQTIDSTYWLPGGINAPKVIRCKMSDGQKVDQLVKGNDDLRQDAVLLKVYAILNALLEKNEATRKRNLSIRTYLVIPLTPKLGVVGWVDNTSPLSAIMSEYHKKYNPHEWRPQQCRKRMDQEHERIGSTPESKLLVYQEICSHFTPVFRYFFFDKFKDADSWFEKRTSYSRSVATTSIAGYITGLGDRHVNNILLDSHHAQVVHIDLGIAFDQGKLLSTPETVPFRLTRDLVDGMGISGVEGTFRTACEETLKVLKSEAYMIQTILDVFRFDPLYRWSQQKAVKSETVTGNKEAARALLGVQTKLSASVSVECQINELIQIAQDPKNLSRMYPGWQPWI